MNLKFKNTILVILSLFTTVATAQTTLWQTTNQKTPYRIPAIAKAKNGHLLAFADYRLDTRDIGYGEVDMYVRISTDNGSSWSNASCIADGTGNSGFNCGFGDAAVVADRERNEVLVMCVAGNQVFGEGASDKHNHMARIRGSYNEETDSWEWSTPEDVTKIFLNDSKALLPNAYTMFIASGRILQSTYKDNGKDYYRIYAALLVKDSSDSYTNYVVYSDDFGDTWSLLGGAAITGANEAKLEELPNGNIIISSRTKGGRIFNEYTNAWNTSNQKTYTFKSNAEDANGELMMYKGLYKVGETTGQTYDVLLQSLPTSSSRGGVTVFYQEVNKDSNLGTLTTANAWKTGKVVDSEASCYSTMTIQANGKIGFLYEDNYGVKKPLFQANYDWADIVYIPYDIETLTNNTYTAKAPVANPIDPTFTISATSETMTVGETLKLTAETNSDGKVSYSSSNTAVATVDATSGNVTAIAAGTATITASVPKTDKYNAASATCTITVKAATVDPDPDPDPEPEPEPEPGPTSITITATSGEIASYAYYAATFSHEKAMTVPSGVKAYYVKASGEDAISLTQVPYGQAIPAGQGVLLISTNVSSMTLTEATENEASLTGNLLMPTLSQESVTFGANDYVLVKRNGEFVFAKASGSTVQNYKNHAYLRLNSNQANVRMIFDDNDATGISGIETDEQDTIYYDLMGRRVTNPTKGIYIKNGKKILIK